MAKAASVSARRGGGGEALPDVVDVHPVADLEAVGTESAVQPAAAEHDASSAGSTIE